MKSWFMKTSEDLCLKLSTNQESFQILNQEGKLGNHMTQRNKPLALRAPSNSSLLLCTKVKFNFSKFQFLHL